MLLRFTHTHTHTHTSTSPQRNETSLSVRRAHGFSQLENQLSATDQLSTRGIARQVTHVARSFDDTATRSSLKNRALGGTIGCCRQRKSHWCSGESRVKSNPPPHRAPRPSHLVMILALHCPHLPLPKHRFRFDGRVRSPVFGLAKRGSLPDPILIIVDDRESFKFCVFHHCPFWVRPIVFDLSAGDEIFWKMLVSSLIFKLFLFQECLKNSETINITILNFNIILI